MDAIVMKEPPTVQRWAELMENFPSDGWEGAAAAIADHDKQVVEYEHALDAHDPSWRAKPLQFTPRSKLDPSAIVVVGDTCVQAAWGALSVSEGQIYGLMSLWLPNVSMSLSMAEDLHRHLGVAIELAKKQVSDAAAN